MNLSRRSAVTGASFGRALALEMRRAICSSRFALGVTMMVVWISLNAAEAVKSYDRAVFAGVTQLIRLGLDGQPSTGPVLLAISTIPYTFSYLTEKDCGFAQQMKQRIGVTVYGACKTIAIAGSAFLMAVVALWIFIGILSAIGIPHTVREGEVLGTYAQWAVSMGPGWYYGAKALHTGLVCGQAALFSLMIMSWIPNAYVGFLSPLIGCYMADCILNLLTRIGSSPLWSLISPMTLFFGQPLPDIGFSYLWTVLVLAALMVCFSIRFLLRLGKEGL